MILDTDPTFEKKPDPTCEKTPDPDSNTAKKTDPTLFENRVRILPLFKNRIRIRNPACHRAKFHARKVPAPGTKDPKLLLTTECTKSIDFNLIFVRHLIKPI